MLNRNEYDNRQFLEKDSLNSLQKVKGYFLDTSIFLRVSIECCVIIVVLN